MGRGYLVRVIGSLVVLVGVAAVAVTVALAQSSGGAAGQVEPSDPYWRQSWSQAVLRMPEVWARTTGSPEVVIATVDTGVDPSIPDLQGALVPGWDFLRGDAVPRDTVGHGTHVASVIAARGNNGIGIAGYCWACRIMPVRISADGSATGQQIADGVYWAVDHGARIVTIGLNSGFESFDESAAVRYAHDKGVLVVASAGNTGTEALRYPAAYPGVLPVAAVNDSDVLYFWSSRGTWVPLAAPGCQLVLDPAVGAGTLCGTSFTPAVVAGIAGLMIALQPSLTPDRIMQVLESTAVPVKGIGGGRINALAALDAVAPPPPTAPGAAAPAGSGSSQGPLFTGRQVQTKAGVMRSRVSRVVRVGAGRLDVLFQASHVAECTIALALANGEFVVGVLPPGEPNLTNLSEVVKAGKQRVEVTCDSTRRRSYQLEISSQSPAR